MADHAKDGGPAFPVRHNNHGQSIPVAMQGMSIRDWFAGQIYPVMVAKAGCEAASGRVGFARLAYHHADELLAARKDG